MTKMLFGIAILEEILPFNPKTTIAFFFFRTHFKILHYFDYFLISQFISNSHFNQINISNSTYKTPTPIANIPNVP